MAEQKIYIILMIVLTIILIALYVMRSVLGKYYRNKLVGYVQECDLEKYNACADKKPVQLLVPPFNIHYMRLNLYMMLENREGIDEEFDFLLGMKTGKAMHQDVAVKAYNYYVKLRDAKRAKPLVEEIRTFADEKTVYECDLLYDVYILKKSNHIDELLEGIEELPLAQRAINEYLVSLQYENRNQPALAKEHEDLSTSYLQQALEAAQQEEEDEEDEYEDDETEDESEDEES